MSLLLDLPPELRRMIWRKLLIHECSFEEPTRKEAFEASVQGRKHPHASNSLYMIIGPPSGLTPSGTCNMTLAVLRTCKLVYAEALPILYAENELEIERPGPFAMFATQVGRSSFAIVRQLVFRIEPTRFRETDAWIAVLQSLRVETPVLRRLSVSLGRARGARMARCSVTLVRELAQLEHIDVLVIEGWYTESWISHLREGLPGHVIGIPEYSTGEIQWPSGMATPYTGPEEDFESLSSFDPDFTLRQRRIARKARHQTYARDFPQGDSHMRDEWFRFHQKFNTLSV